jgi:LMBR1-like membrane protein
MLWNVPSVTDKSVKLYRDKLQGYVMAMANSWGLLLAIIFMGYGLVAIPRKLWYTANVRKQLKHLYIRAPKVKEECMDSELEYTDVAKVTVIEIACCSL